VSWGAIILRLCYAPYHNDPLQRQQKKANELPRELPSESKPDKYSVFPASNSGLKVDHSAGGSIFDFLVICGVSTTVIGFNTMLLFGLWKYPETFYGLLLYYMYILLLSQPETDEGSRWDWFTRNFIALRALRRFLGIQLMLNEQLLVDQAKENAQLLFAVFPHGANSDFRIALDGMLLDALPNVGHKTHTLAATVLFRIPIVREMALWTGCVDARRSVAESMLRRKQSLLVLPGGQAEQIRTVYGREIVYLKKRKGFLKLAMTHGVPVVPVYAFGASDYFYTFDFLHDLRLWLVKAMGISIPLAFGHCGAMICPRAVSTTIVFGKPLVFKVSSPGSPTADEIDVAHEQFCKALLGVFDANKKEVGYGDRTLEIQ